MPSKPGVRPPSPARATLIYGLLAWTAIVPVLPLILISLTTLAIYKSVVVLLASLLRKRDLVRPLTGLDISFSTDDFFQKPRGVLAYILVVNGMLSKNQIIDRLDQFFTKEKGNDGFEKLTSVFPVFWLGFPFWKRTHVPFRVQNHVKEIRHDGRFTTSRYSKLNELICEWIQQPFSQGRPLWEILISCDLSPSDINNIQFCSLEKALISVTPFDRAKDDLPTSNGDWLVGHSTENKEKEDNFGKKSILIFKTHHVIGDGNSMLRLLENILDTENDSKKTEDNQQECTCPPCPTTSDWKDQNRKICLQNFSAVPPSLMQKERVHKYNHKKWEETRVHHFQQDHHCGLSPCGPRRGITGERNDSDGSGIFEPFQASESQKAGNKNKFSFYCVYQTVRTSIIKIWINVWKSIRQKAYTLKRFMVQAKAKGRSLFHQLSEAILLAFFAPLSVFILLKDFGIHRDPWFTQKKDSDKLNLATVHISMKRLSKIRQDLYRRHESTTHTQLQSNDRPNLTFLEMLSPIKSDFSKNDGDHNESFCKRNFNVSLGKVRAQKEVRYQRPSENVPLVLIAISALAGALRRVLMKAEKETGKWEDNQQSRAIGVSDGDRKEDICDIGAFGGTVKLERNCTNKHCAAATSLLREKDVCISETPEGEGLLPCSSNFVIALPLHKRHPGSTQFCNFWTHGIVRVNMNEVDSHRRLDELNNFYWDMRSKRNPEIYHSLVNFHSLLPEPILKLIAAHNMGASIGVTNLAGFPRSVFIGGHEVIRKYAYVGLQWRHASITLGLVSYNGDISATLLVNAGVIPRQEDVEKLMSHYFVEELKALAPTHP